MLPNHFHLVVWRQADGDLSRGMHWVQNMHVRCYHRHYPSSGHVWQGRFRAFPVQEDEHLLTVLRYVERNPVRANLAARAEHWQWSNACCWQEPGLRPSYLGGGPGPQPAAWLESVNQPATPAELAALRRCVHRGTPFGSAGWVEQTARRLHLESTLGPNGRPRKHLPSPFPEK